VKEILDQYKAEPESVFDTWFINNDDRLRAFRSIRRGVRDVIQNIKVGSFGNDYKGSSHAFWQEYLRIHEVILDTNRRYKNLFSRDPGAFSVFLFGIGVKNIPAAEPCEIDGRGFAPTLPGSPGRIFLAAYRGSVLPRNRLSVDLFAIRMIET